MAAPQRVHIPGIFVKDISWQAGVDDEKGLRRSVLGQLPKQACEHRGSQMLNYFNATAGIEGTGQ